jgi:hypothetical protein
MITAELMGGHSRESARGTNVHVLRPGLTYFARGRLDGRPFDETLSTDTAAAVAGRELIHLGVEVAYGLCPWAMGVPHA